MGRAPKLRSASSASVNATLVFAVALDMSDVGTGCELAPPPHRADCSLTLLVLVNTGRGEEGEGSEDDEREEEEEEEEEEDDDDDARPRSEKSSWNNWNNKSISCGPTVSIATPISIQVALLSALAGSSLEFVKAELPQPCESQERCSRAGSPGASRTNAAAHAGGPVGQAPPAMKQFVRQRALPRHVTIWSPASGATRPGASIAFIERTVRSFAGRCARPAGVHESVAARTTASINCGSSVGQPGEGRASVARTDLLLESGPGNAPQARSSMKLAETCAMCVTLLLRISSFTFEKKLTLVVKLLFTRSCCCGSSSDAHPFTIIVARRKPALAVTARCRRPACRHSITVSIDVAWTIDPLSEIFALQDPRKNSSVFHRGGLMHKLQKGRKRARSAPHRRSPRALSRLVHVGEPTARPRSLS
jgi:hypothetical protein